jgi:hypothetical protein
MASFEQTLNHSLHPTMLSKLILIVAGIWFFLVPLLTVSAALNPPAIESVLEEKCPVVYVPLLRSIERRVHRMHPKLYFPVVGWRNQQDGAPIETLSRSERIPVCNVLDLKARSIERKVRSGELTPTTRILIGNLLLLWIIPAVLLAGSGLLVSRARR